MTAPRSPTNHTFSRIPMSSSVPSRLQSAAQLFGPPDARRTPTPGTSHTQPGTTMTPGGHHRRNSQLRSSVAESSSLRLGSAMGTVPGSSASVLGQVQSSSGTRCKESSVVTFEWPISGWDLLGKVRQGEDAEEDEEERPDIMRRGIVFGDGVYKADIAADSGQDPFDNTPDSPIALSIFLTCTTVETAPIEYSFTTSIFAGIRPAHIDVGQRYAETQWSWYTNTTHEYSRETDYARIALPDYQSVLVPQQPGEWVLVLQITCPPAGTTLGTFSEDQGVTAGWTLPGQVNVPRDIISGLGDLLDSPSGDVQFVCLEHSRGSPEDEQGEEMLLSRKRVIYAHSEILKARSTYFKMLLDGGFRETEGQARRTVAVDDAGYDTVYWLLRTTFLGQFIYCNALTFSQENDVRLLMDTSSLDRGAIHKLLSSKSPSPASSSHRHHWPASQPMEWDYRALPQDPGSEGGEGDAMSGTLSMSMSMTLSEPDGQSVSEVSVVSGQGRVISPTKEALAARRPSGGLGAETQARSVHPGGVSPAAASGRRGVPSINAATPTVAPRRGAPPSSMAATAAPTPSKSALPRMGERQPSSSAVSRSAKPPTSPLLGKHGMPSGAHRPLRLSDVAPVPDPHPHPAPAPAPPSALGMYMLSHRYDMPVLEGLAKERILKGLTPDKCMPMLLATHAYDTLHAEVLDFVIDYFGLIQVTPEFKAAVREVSSGQWGSTGGDVLLGMFQRL